MMAAMIRKPQKCSVTQLLLFLLLTSRVHYVVAKKTDAPSPTPISCSLCYDETTIIDPNQVALVDGKTCGELSLQANFISENDPLCFEYYRYMGYTKCGCGPLFTNNVYHEYNPNTSFSMVTQCSICGDGKEVDWTNSLEPVIFEDLGETTCLEAQEYASFYSIDTPLCDSFQSISKKQCDCIDIFSELPSLMPSTGPTKQASVQPSSNPTLVSSNEPSFYPTSQPSISQSPTLSPTLSQTSQPSISQSPSLSPTLSSNPSTYPTQIASSAPSIEPTTFYDRNVNCTEIENGILPSQSILNNDKMNQVKAVYNLDLSLRPSALVEIAASPSTLDAILYDLQSMFRKLVSMSVIDSCNVSDEIQNRMMQSLSDVNNSSISNYNGTTIDLLDQEGIKIFLVNFIELKYLGDQFYCDNDNIIHSIENCFVVEGRFDIYYTSLHIDQAISIDLVDLIGDVFKEKLSNIPNEIESVERVMLRSSSMEMIEEVTEINVSDSLLTNSLIGVAIVCSSLVVFAVLIISRGRRKKSRGTTQRFHYSESAEMSIDIPDRHIRSDDSVSNSPTGNGWDDTTSDAISESSSRPSYTVQVDEAVSQHGVDASRAQSYHDNPATYLPSSVLKDLLDGNGQSRPFV